MTKEKETLLQFDAVSTILTWSIEMCEAGHMPQQVVEAFTRYFESECEGPGA